MKETIFLEHLFKSAFGKKFPEKYGEYQWRMQEFIARFPGHPVQQPPLERLLSRWGDTKGSAVTRTKRTSSFDKALFFEVGQFTVNLTLRHMPEAADGISGCSVDLPARHHIRRLIAIFPPGRLPQTEQAEHTGCRRIELFHRCLLRGLHRIQDRYTLYFDIPIWNIKQDYTLESAQ